MRRSLASSLVLGAACLAALTACIPTPPSVAPPSSPATTAPTTAPSGPTETTEPSSPTTTAPSDPGDVDPLYDTVADDGQGVVWSFQPSEIEVIEVDASGDPARDGYKLVLVHLDGQLIAGDGWFYYDFTVKLVDGADGHMLGLSSGTDYIADNDLFFAGTDTFEDGQGIYEVPEDFELGQLYVEMNATGENWTFDVDVTGE